MMLPTTVSRCADGFLMEYRVIAPSAVLRSSSEGKIRRWFYFCSHSSHSAPLVALVLPFPPGCLCALLTTLKHWIVKWNPWHVKEEVKTGLEYFKFRLKRTRAIFKIATVCLWKTVAGNEPREETKQFTGPVGRANGKEVELHGAATPSIFPPPPAP